MKRVLIVQPPGSFQKKEEASDSLNFRREFLNIAELITSTFTNLEQKISFLDTKINSVSRVCCNILQQTENFIKDKSIFTHDTCKCCQELSYKIESVHKLLSSFTDVMQLLTAESLSQKQNANQDLYVGTVRCTRDSWID